MLPELRPIVVRYIAVEIGELIKPLKWRTMNAKTNAIAGNGADNITAIALINRVVICDDLIDT